MLTDYGPVPFVVDVNRAALHNDNYRTTLWTASHLQLALMSIPVGSDIGLEVHPDVDQFIYIVDGQGVTQMGSSQDNLFLRQPVFNNYAIFVPAGTWHNVTNTGSIPLKLFTVYAPPEHPWGTVHKTKATAKEMER